MKVLKKALVAAASVAGLMAVVGTAPAMAATIPFTWDPSLTSGTALSTPSFTVIPGNPPTIGPGLSPQFTADSFGIRDYATIDTTNLANVTEHATLVITQFSNVLPSLTQPGFVPGNGGGLASAQQGATPYQLYFVVDALSTLAPDGTGGLEGSFTSLTYTFYGDVGGMCTFSVPGPDCSASGQQLVLATGHLAPGGINTVSIKNGTPKADVDTTIIVGANAGGFFVDPNFANIVKFAFESAFTNTTGVAVQGSVYTINGGGGNANLVALPVPEPLTLSLFGAGLVGVAAVRRRKSKKA